jgi:hypothetical protein
MLSQEQQAEFHRSGILRVPGAIAARAAASMCDSIWDMLSRNYKIRRDDSETWKAQRIMGTKERPKAITVAQVVNPALRATLDQLLAPEKWDCDQHWGSLLVSFPGAFPEASAGWNVPSQGWHLDAPVVRALPDLYGVRIFTCLAKVEPQGGATLAVAGSPRLARALANARGVAKLRSADVRKGLVQRHSWIKDLCSPGDSRGRVARFMNTGATIEDVDIRVIEMTGEPGDVYLVHPVMMHAGSPNCLKTPRMVLSSTVYQRGVDWSALYGAEREVAA